MQLQYGNVSIVGSGQGVTTLTCRYDGSGGTQNSYYGMLVQCGVNSPLDQATSGLPW